MSRPETVQAFLHYGFVPRVPADLEQRPWAHPGSTRDRGAEDAIERGVRTLRERFTDVPAGTQVVPLSGGLDSRAILGMLVRAGARERVVAVTFGTPGTLDFELGRVVARHAGVRHEAIDLTRTALDEACLRAALRPAPAWTHALEAHFNDLIPARFGRDAVVWSGIMANVINGSRVGPPGQTWPQARRAFAESLRHARSIVLTRPGFDPTSVLPAEPPLPRGQLTPEEQLYVTLIYPCRFDLVLLAPGQTYRTPFREQPWVDWALGLPPELRRDERGFRAVLQRELPEWMALPSKNHAGQAPTAPAWRVALARQRLRAGRVLRRRVPAWPWPPQPQTNYLDFDHELRRDTPLRAVVRALLGRLVARGTVQWLDVEDLRRRHERGRGAHGTALVLLALLELHQAREGQLGGQER